MKAIVTHGGAGTTAAALSAGKPTIVVPHFGDQTLWGNYVHKKLGAGPAPIPSTAFNVENLVTAIKEAVSNEQMKENAKLVAEKIAKEDGIAKALEVINKVKQEDKQWKEDVKWFEDFPWKKANRPVPSTREDFLWLKEHGMFPFTKEEIEATVAN